VSVDSENNVMELSIAPDGRVFVHGTSRAVLEVLEVLDPHDVRVKVMLQYVREMEKAAAMETKVLS
jgi:hypothetical protein